MRDNRSLENGRLIDTIIPVRRPRAVETVRGWTITGERSVVAQKDIYATTDFRRGARSLFERRDELH